MPRLAAATVVLMLGAILPTQADSQTLEKAWGGGIGATAVGDFGGLTLAAFGELHRAWLFGSAGLDMSVGPGDGNTRYYRDSFSNGQSRCRDSSTGQFATDAKCLDAETDLAMPVEGGFSIPLKSGAQLLTTAGLRFGKESRPFGLTGIPESLGRHQLVDS